MESREDKSGVTKEEVLAFDTPEQMFYQFSFSSVGI